MPQPTHYKPQAHQRSSVIIHCDDIARVQQQSKPARNPNDNLKDTSESIILCESVSMMKHGIGDDLVARDVSNHQELDLDGPRISHGEPPRTPTANHNRNSYANGLYGQPVSTGAPTETHETTIRPSLPSIMNSPFAPRPGEASPSPHSRPGTAHRHLHPPASGTRLEAALLRQQAELEMQHPSSIYDLPTTSLSQPTSSPGKHPQFRLGRDLSPIPSPFASSPSVTPDGAMFPSYDVPRHVPEQSRFGAVGQTPPSGQGG